QLAWSSGAPETFAIDVRNCMPGAKLEVVASADASASTPAVSSSARDETGTCHFRLGDLGGLGDLALSVAPPGTDAPRPFRFAVLSDIQEAINHVQDIYRLINAEAGVEFVFSAGDLTERGSSAQLERFQRELEQLAVPYFTTLGNHELGHSPALFRQYFGRGSESFEYRGVRFTLLDSASATIDPIVLDWLETWMAAADGELHIVAMHIPPLDPFGVRNGAFASRDEAADLLGRLAQGGVALTLYGHIHSYYHFENAGIPAYISGGGGAIPERFDHIGRHFLVVDADPLAHTTAVRVVRVD
ncbi:MAG TPA: metallophosphoesterase, partial [Polyangiaceae bacterium]|nr:metallophosphoesterase [Polyangiaceae bacterium]